MSSGTPSSQVLSRWIAAGLPDDHARRPEGTGACYPQLWRTGDVADVGLPAENQHVEVVLFHLGQRPLPATGAQRAVVG